jgi:hypothetical protein
MAGGRVARAPDFLTSAAAGILPPGFPRDPHAWRDRVLHVLGENALIGKTAPTDISRLLALPICPLDRPRCPDPEGYAATLRHHAAPSDFAFRALQIDAAWEYETLGGLISPLGVGHGKTIVTGLVGKIGLQRRGHRRVVLLVPPEVVDQLVKRDLPSLRRWIALDGIPIWHVHGGSGARRKICEQPGPGLWVYTYSLLSQPTAEEEMRAIHPTLWICDEAHNVARRTAARTRRFIHLFEDMDRGCREGRFGPDVTAKNAELVALSGTITRRSIKDYAHLSNMALVNASPIPFYQETIRLLSLAIDSDSNQYGSGLTEDERLQANRYLEWAYDQGLTFQGEQYRSHTWPDKMREAYQHRIRTSPGVIGSSDAGVEASLIISWSEPPRPKGADGELMVAHMKRIAEEMKTPDGDEIDFGMHSFKWYYELSSGFYNSLRWPTEDEVMIEAGRKGKVVTKEAATAAIELAKRHHAFKQDYHVKLRQFLKQKRVPKCDTPMLVALELTHQREGKPAKHSLPRELKDAYRIMKEADFEDLPQRKRRSMRICDYKVAAACQWAKQYHPDNGGPGGFIWYHHPEIGEWICELLTEQGIPFTFAPAGENDAPFVDGIVVASYSHGTGKNLQHQSRNLFVELPHDGAVTMEQTIGRTHRAGQKSDDVRCDVFVANGFDMAYFNHILRDADYIQSSMGQVQRLCFATYSPLVPAVNPLLIERLGIVEEGQDLHLRKDVAAHESLTPPEALDWSSVFRSAQYVSTPVPVAGP